MRQFEDIRASHFEELGGETSPIMELTTDRILYSPLHQAHALAQWEDDEYAFDEDDEDVEYIDEDDDLEDEDWEEEEFDIDEDDFVMDDDEEMDFDPYEDDEDDDEYFDDEDEPEDHWGHQVEDVLPSPGKPAYYMAEARFK